MRIGYGNGGWVAVTDADGLPETVYLRLASDARGTWTVRELYLATGRITPAVLRKVPLADVELVVNAEPEIMAAKADKPGPDLVRLAAHYSTSFGPKVRHWVAESLRAQDPRYDVEQAPMPRRRDTPTRRRPPLVRSDRLDDEFLRAVAEAYVDVVTQGLHPAPALAKETGAPLGTVRRWILQARKRGFLPEGTQGRAGI